LNPPLEFNNALNHKRIRPFNLNSEEEAENSMEISEKSSEYSSFKEKKHGRNGKNRDMSVDLFKVSDLNAYFS